jgi:hypothetical protein
MRKLQKTVKGLRRYDMNGRSHMMGGENWILPKEINATGSSGTLIGWKAEKPLLRIRIEGAWLWSMDSVERKLCLCPIAVFGFHPLLPPRFS